MKKTTTVLAGLAATTAVIGGALAYSSTLVNDGTSRWDLATNGASVVLQVNAANAAGWTTSTIVSKLPTCNSGLLGVRGIVTDSSTVTYGGAITGGASTVTSVLCNGTAWVYG